MGPYKTKACVHRWILGEPTMQSVPGVCRRCGAQRSYPSGIEIPEAVPEYTELNQLGSVRPSELMPLREYAQI